MAPSPVSHCIMSQDVDCYGSIQASLLRTHCCECPQRDRVRQSAGNTWPQCWSRPGRADDKLRLQCDSLSPKSWCCFVNSLQARGKPGYDLQGVSRQPYLRGTLTSLWGSRGGISLLTSPTLPDVTAFQGKSVTETSEVLRKRKCLVTESLTAQGEFS